MAIEVHSYLKSMMRIAGTTIGDPRNLDSDIDLLSDTDALKLAQSIVNLNTVGTNDKPVDLSLIFNINPQQ